MAYDPATRGFTIFDARDVTPDGAVASWADGGGRNTVTQGTSANRPTKGSGVIAFDGTNDLLNDTARSFGTPTSSDLDTAWAAYAGYDSVQMCNTGLALAPNGTWWVVNAAFGRPDTILLNFSADFSTVLDDINLGTVYGTGVIGAVQGVVYDTDDDTLWFCSTATDTIRHITLDGVDIAADEIDTSISLPNPTGLAIDQANGHLIAIESEGSASNKSAGAMATFNKATGALVSSGTLTNQVDWDHLYFDEQSRALFITSGYEYSGNGNTFVGIYSLDGAGYIEQLALVREPTATAIEGIVYHDGKLYVCNNSAFHGGTGSGVNEVLEYDCGSIVGRRIVMAFAGNIGTGTPTDTMMMIGEPFGSTGSHGMGFYTTQTSDEIRVFVREVNGDQVTGKWTFTDHGASAGDHIMVVEWDKIANTLSLWIDGTAATFVEFTGTGVLANLDQTFTDRMRLTLGAAYESGTNTRHAEFDAYAMGYGVLYDTQADERQELEGWLAHEFSLTANLPSGHPYKTTAPNNPQDVEPFRFENDQTFYSASISQNDQLLPSLFTNSQTFPAATVARGPGATPLEPSLITNTQTFYALTVAQGSGVQLLEPALIANASVFYDAGISQAGNWAFSKKANPGNWAVG